MKVYVDKLPKDCWECPCFRFSDNESPCGLNDKQDDYFKFDGECNCPLHTIGELRKSN